MTAATNLAQVADELYALPPAAFTAARDEQARQARDAGDADLAGAIKKLRRPTVSAWLVNLLVRDATEQVAELLDLGASLREAQQALAGDRLRDLSTQRRELVTAISQEAKRLAAQAGQSVSAQVEREVRDTLEAALADPDIADAVRSGRLTSALSYAGLGEGIGVDDAVAVRAAPPARQDRHAPPSPAHERGKQTAPASQAARQHPAASRPPAREPAAARREQQKADAAERERQRAEAAERDRREAAAEAREAQSALDEAEREVTSARDQQEVLQRRIGDLEKQLDQTYAESAQGSRNLRQAQRSRDVAARARDAAVRRLARAEAKASQPRG